ncbi:unnamed protein product (macronuclear) [Paramecium tetraurelia]|uniref:HSF-type DNA-binding domain-containing protein n=1 Tax=Paramecium tetraurelia TaxID=5888 RepID=A0CNC4_PARTE|nr:uncharacterized protein GSPATT00008733001 [Paramecium tetraurelia]CAK72291.1 unnamed protein product [Paramecium tetraurelia]|eukprot:XP_001439688.1 hypothetical protein (macronuclear) [Paramecium tetraurelia strain d4-2]
MNTKSSIPTFILKTYQMLEDQKNTNVISWTSQGTAFIVYNQILLEKEVLQNFFKHSNYSSFVRQLNLYNFKKVKSNEGQIFKHKCFRKGMKQYQIIQFRSMLSFIKRKNQDDSVGGSNTLVQEEPTIHIKEEQNLFKECAIDIKETNNKLKEDMKLLQETSSYLIDQMQNLNHPQQFVYNQSVDIEVKFKQVGQMLHAINEELRQENKSETITNKFMDKKEESFQESKVGSPNPYVDYNSTALNPLDYEYFIDSFL